MTSALRVSIASAALISAACIMTTPAAIAGGLAERYTGGMKDFGYVAPPRAAAGPCYFRADVGYSAATDPEVTWPVNNERFNSDDSYDNATGAAGADGFADGDTNQNGVIDQDEIYFERAGTTVNNVEIDDNWFGEVGVGCGSGSRGFRAEVAFGFRGTQGIDGEPAIYEGSIVGDPTGTPTPTPIDDPLHTDLQTYTMMFNVYKDLGLYRGFVPYIGAGIGVAYHRVGEVSFTENPALTNTIEGNNDISFAWSLMAGAAYQVSDRAVLDVGYRYMDLGKAESGRADNAGFVNPAVKLDDITAHEIKIGLRYHFGSSASPAPVSYAPAK